MSSRSDIAMVAAMGIVGLLGGVLFLPNATWGGLGLILGGGLIGREIVRALCLPGSCTTVEVFGGIGTGIGAMFGIGLVTALVVRSFEEYRGGSS